MGQISICTPFHLQGKKGNLAYEKCFRHYSNSRIHVNLCGSEGNLSRNFAGRFLNDTTHYVEVKQGDVCLSSKGDDVLRQKFNDSLATLPDSDWKCLIGADDIIPLEFFDWLVEQDSSAIIMAGQSIDSIMYPVDMGVYPNVSSIAKIKLKYKVDLKLTGGINCFTRSAMTACNQRPYQLDGCETGAEIMFQGIGTILSTDGYVIMPKIDSALNKWQKLKDKHENQDVTIDDVLLIQSYLQ